MSLCLLLSLCLVGTGVIQTAEHCYIHFMHVYFHTGCCKSTNKFDDLVQECFSVHEKNFGLRFFRDLLHGGDGFDGLFFLDWLWIFRPIPLEWIIFLPFRLHCLFRHRPQQLHENSLQVQVSFLSSIIPGHLNLTFNLFSLFTCPTRYQIPSLLPKLCCCCNCLLDTAISTCCLPCSLAQVGKLSSPSQTTYPLMMSSKNKKKSIAISFVLFGILSYDCNWHLILTSSLLLFSRLRWRGTYFSTTAGILLLGSSGPTPRVSTHSRAAPCVHP